MANKTKTATTTKTTTAPALMGVVIAAPEVGMAHTTPTPYTIVTADTYRQARAVALRLAAQVEERSETERWIVRIGDERNYNRRVSFTVELELALGTLPEAQRGLDALVSAVAQMRARCSDPTRSCAERAYGA